MDLNFLNEAKIQKEKNMMYIIPSLLAKNIYRIKKYTTFTKDSGKSRNPLKLSKANSRQGLCM